MRESHILSILTVAARFTWCFVRGADPLVRYCYLNCTWQRINTVLDTPGKLRKIIVDMTKALRKIPVTVKLRAGVKNGRNSAHKLLP